MTPMTYGTNYVRWATACKGISYGPTADCSETDQADNLVFTPNEKAAADLVIQSQATQPPGA